MAEGLKDNWKKVGKDWASLGTDLGKSLLNTMKTGVREATKWADEKPEKEEAEAEANTEEPKAEEPKTEEPKAEE